MKSKILLACSMACALIVTTTVSDAQARTNPTYDDLLELFADELNLLAKVPFREQLVEGATRP